MEMLKCIGNAFYCDGRSQGQKEVFTAAVMFPCLEELIVSDCPLLESVPLTGRCLSLKKLRVEDCSRLSSIGDGLATAMLLEE
ncbi:hypothetical protein P5E91_15560, partial [Clostridium perfringens]|nr:hypothetical protein [Clostridium perfringens]